MNNDQQIQDLQTQVKDLKNQIDILNNTNQPKNNFEDAQTNLFDIIGLIPSYTTSTELSQKIAFPPRTIYGQIFLYTTGGVTKLYMYDTSNTSSTFSNGWHYVTLT